MPFVIDVLERDIMISAKGKQREARVRRMVVVVVVMVVVLRLMVPGSSLQRGFCSVTSL